MKIGILALQGAFIEHKTMLERLGCGNFEIRKKEDVKAMDGLILPGGESTVMTKLLHELALYEPLSCMIRNGLPVFGTCAGLILLAKDVIGGKTCFGCMNITARRNAYGRQLGSFRTKGYMAGIGTIPMVFIRGPYIEHAGDRAEVLARVEGHIVAARQDNMLVVSFHPELMPDERLHSFFLDMAAKHRAEKTARAI